MSITLERFQPQDTTYISKHNANVEQLEQIINTILTQLGQQSGGIISVSTVMEALFGPLNAVIGAGSYLPTPSGSNLSVAAGYAWLTVSAEVVKKLSSTTISFAGLAAGTYYLIVNSSGEPARSTDPSQALYQIEWTGSAFGTITRLANVAWGYQTFNIAKTSTVLGQTWQELDDRLEAGEALWTAPQPYDVAIYIPGVPTAGATLITKRFTRSVTFPAGFADSQSGCEVAATASTVFSLRKNNSQIGTVTIGAGNTEGIFALATEITFVAGDRLTVVAPDPADATLAGLSLTLAGTR